MLHPQFTSTLHYYTSTTDLPLCPNMTMKLKQHQLHHHDFIEVLNLPETPDLPPRPEKAAPPACTG